MENLTVLVSTSTQQFVLTQADQDYILLLGLGCFIYLMFYRMFVDYFGLA